MPNPCYVFVVCGDESHVQTLEISLQLLRRFSEKRVIVVTDTSRTKWRMEDVEVIDVKTPAPYSNKQAAIYLKTGLGHILPRGALYCYLDTDVLAVREGVDSIFEHYLAPVTFCSDISRLAEFAPYALREPGRLARDELAELERQRIDLQGLALKKFGGHHRKIRELLYDFEETHLSAPREQRRQFAQELDCFLREADQSPPAGPPLLRGYLLLEHLRLLRPVHAFGARQQVICFLLKVFALPSAIAFRGLLGLLYRRDSNCWVRRFSEEVVLKEEAVLFRHFVNRGYFLNPINGIWFDTQGRTLNSSPHCLQQYAASFGYRYDSRDKSWFSPQGELVLREAVDASSVPELQPGSPDTSQPKMSLLELIRSKFGVQIPDKNWQHWNGGVFLFDDRGRDFLQRWHAMTLEIFKDPQWAVRDQGTLVAAVWQSGLQNQPLLPIEYNFLADYYAPHVRYARSNFEFSLARKRRGIRPYFLHVYHHFGDVDWELWQDVQMLLSSEPIPDRRRVAHE